MNPVDVKEYPRRVKKLAEHLDGLNGDPLTAAESRALVKLLGETQLDLWDMVISLTTDVDAWMKNAKRVLTAIFVAVFGGALLWIGTELIPKIIAHIEAANLVVK